MPKSRIRTGAIVASLGLGLAAALAFPISASAHTGSLTASAVCATDGTRVVTYSGSTTGVPETGPGHTAELAAGDVLPSDATLTPATQTVVGDADYVLTETLDGAELTAAITATLTWGDGEVAALSGDIGFATACVVTPPVTPPIITPPTTPDIATAAADVVPATCAEPSSAGFTLADATWDDATDTTDGTRIATAMAGHVFSDGSDSMTVTYAVNPALDPTGALCAAGSTPPTLAVTGSTEEAGVIGIVAAVVAAAGAAMVIAVARIRSRSRRRA